jgi:hypothetical protein
MHIADCCKANELSVRLCRSYMLLWMCWSEPHALLLANGLRRQLFMTAEKSIKLHGVVTVRGDGFTEPVTGPYTAGPVRVPSYRSLPPSALLQHHINLCSPTRHLCAVYLYSGMSHSNSVHNRVQWASPLLDPIVIRVNLTHTLTPYFLEVHFNIILPSIPMSPKWYVLFRYCNQNSEIISSIPTSYTPLDFLLLSSYTKKLFLFIVSPFSVHRIWIFTADIDRYTRRPNPCGIVLWQGFLNSPSTWVKHFTLPCITLYPLLHGQSHISFCQITSCHACKHSALSGVTTFQKFQRKWQIRAADKITMRIVVYSISIRWIHIDFQSTRKTTANSDC